MAEATLEKQKAAAAENQDDHNRDENRNIDLKSN
jgi:hypothetical protein